MIPAVSNPCLETDFDTLLFSFLSFIKKGGNIVL